jgi:hypothetical protein
MMASTDARMAFFFIQDPPFPQDGLPEGAFPDDLPFLGSVNDHVHADARPQDIGDDIPESLGEVAVRPADDDHVVIAVGQGIPPRPGAEQDDAFGSVLPEGPDDAAEHGVTPGVASFVCRPTDGM